MSIFRLPAHLNAFRSNILDISSRFQSLPFSTLIRPHRAVPPCSPLPVTPRLISSRFSSRLASRPVSARSAHRFSPRLTSSRLPCRSIVPPLSSPRLPCRGAERETELVVAIRCVRCPLPVSVAFQSHAKLAPPLVSPYGEGGGKEQPCPCRLRVCAISV